MGSSLNSSSSELFKYELVLELCFIEAKRRVLYTFSPLHKYMNFRLLQLTLLNSMESFLTFNNHSFFRRKFRGEFYTSCALGATSAFRDFHLYQSQTYMCQYHYFNEAKARLIHGLVKGE